MSIHNKYLPIVALLSALLFAFVCCYFIAYFHVSPLSRDMWHMYAPYFEHGWWHAAVTPMSNHRHMLLFFFLLLDMELFSGHNHLITTLGFLFNSLIIVLLCICLWQEKQLPRPTTFILTAFFIVHLTWLIHIAQLGWGFMSFNYYLSILCYLLAIYSACNYVLNKKTFIWLIVSIGMGILCTFTFGIGILVWPSLLILSYIWRAPNNIYYYFIFACIFSLFVFFIMPGGDSIDNALIFQPVESALFTLQLPAGPVYYLLKSWRFIDTETCKFIAKGIGVTASVFGLFFIFHQLRKRQLDSAFLSLCFAMMLLGFGSAALITLTRGIFFLDIWVDRYQIWATFFWAGLLAYSITYFYRFDLFRRFRQSLLMMMVLLPILYLPSHLDLGSRLAEYKNRVSKALLSYQLFIPDKTDAHNALHWNWQHNLPFLFYVLDHLRGEEKNIFSKGSHNYVGLPINSIIEGKKTLTFSLESLATETISTENLLDPRDYPYANNSDKLDKQWPSSYGAFNASRIYGNVPEEIDWNYAFITDSSKTIIGLGNSIEYPALPRGNLKYIGREYNFYGVGYIAPNDNFFLYLLSDERPEKIYVTEIN